MAAVYNLADGKIASVEGSGGVSSMEDMAMRPMEAVFAQAWYTSITNDMFG
ncbi:MAG: FCSD flavin-binding domain-containing protein [Thiolinea sp.]